MKKRLDVLVTENGLAPSREKAKALIMAGCIYVNGQKEDKAGAMFEETAVVTMQGNKLPYVSRGGLKLEKALQVFPISLEGSVAVDIGASTGGFTDCMLQNGAAKVYAIDVGYGQLAYSLRNDPRVVNMERTNIRNVRPEDLAEKADFASVDVSFISLRHIFPVMKQLLKESGQAVCLIKPQFEAGREKVGKKGVVREEATHREVIANVIGLVRENGFAVCGLDFSPVKGPEGNIEYLLYLKPAESLTAEKEPEDIRTDSFIAELVSRSHRVLNEKTQE
ncbi:MAG: TlyA family RNA methyltransferase [Lachnospiraceae bacterium]|nr:TlyA family RNA methyltransferase [Lachnospiraceae bacterium]